MRTKVKNSGFTLIELLVVLAIIGVLIALAIVGLLAAQSAQRDTSRKDITSQVNAELQSWVSNYGCFPLQSGSAVCAGQGFEGNGNTNLINTGGSCANSSMTVNNSCIGLDGLNNPTTLQCTANAPTITGTTYTLCFTPNAGAAGYQLGVALESKNGTNAWYYISR